MKRLISALLTVGVLAGGLGVPASAEEWTGAGEELSTPARYDLLDANGPWGEWTDAQKAAAESWTDADWEGYWYAYYKTYGNFWEDRNNWERERGTAAPEEPSGPDPVRRREKEAMGMPFPDGGNVSLNGKYLSFDGTVPLEGTTGSLYVPARSFLEGRGATVGYQDGAVTARFPDGGSLMFTLGEDASLAFEKDGTAYINVETLACEMGLSVYYDAYDRYDLVELIDWEQLGPEIDRRFTRLNAILAAAQNTFDRDKTYAMDDSLRLTATLYGDTEPGTATVTLRRTGLFRADSQYCKDSIQADLGTLSKPFSALFLSSSPEQEQELKDWLRRLSQTTHETIWTADMAYTRGDVPEFGGQEVPARQDVWVQQGQTAPPLPWPDGQASFATLLRGSFTGGSLYENGNTVYQQLEAMLDLCEGLMGDRVIQVRQEQDTAVYHAHRTLGDFAADAVRYPRLNGMDLGMMIGRIGQAPKAVTLDYTVKVRGGKLYDLDFAFAMDKTSTLPRTWSVALSGSPWELHGTFALKGDYFGKIETALTHTAKISAQPIPSAPPDGAAVRKADR